MAECFSYNCDGEVVTELKAWGSGEIRQFCADCARLRRKLSGYSEVEGQ